VKRVDWLLLVVYGVLVAIDCAVWAVLWVGVRRALNGGGQ
jgi:hypothetical protein